jgi:hypothetical protein
LAKCSFDGCVNFDDAVVDDQADDHWASLYVFESGRVPGKR